MPKPSTRKKPEASKTVPEKQGIADHHRFRPWTARGGRRGERNKKDGQRDAEKKRRLPPKSPRQTLIGSRERRKGQLVSKGEKEGT